MMIVDRKQQTPREKGVSPNTPLPPYFPFELNQRMASYANKARQLGYSDEQLRDELLVADIAHNFRRDSVQTIVRMGHVPEKLKRALPGLVERGVDSVLPPRKHLCSESSADDEKQYEEDDEADMDDDGNDAELYPPMVLYYGSIIITLSAPNSPAKVSYATNLDYRRQQQGDDEEDELCDVSTKKGKKEVLSIKEIREYAVDEVRGWPEYTLHALSKWCSENCPDVKLRGDEADISALDTEQAKCFFWAVMHIREKYWKMLKTHHRIQLKQAEHDATTVDESIYDHYRVLAGEHRALAKPRKIRHGWSVPVGCSTLRPMWTTTITISNRK